MPMPRNLDSSSASVSRMNSDHQGLLSKSARKGGSTGTQHWDEKRLNEAVFSHSCISPKRRIGNQNARLPTELRKL